MSGSGDAKMSGSLIRNRDYMRQIKDFSGLRFDKIYPTDIDGFLDFGNRIFIFIEMKHGDARIPYGQSLALTRLCDSTASEYRKSYLLIARHSLSCDDDIDASIQPVTAVYHEGKWSQVAEGWTLKRMIDWILEKHNRLGVASG